MRRFCLKCVVYSIDKINLIRINDRLPACENQPVFLFATYAH